MAEFLGFELKEFDTATLTANYQNLGSALLNACKHATIMNNTSVDVYVTTNGTTNDFRIPAGKELVIPSYDQHNTRNDGSYVFKKGTQLKVKQVTAAAAGSVVVHIFT